VKPEVVPAPVPAPAVPPLASIAVTPLGAPEVLDPAALARGPDIEFGIRKGDRFEIRVSGSGWTYLGESAGQEGIGYELRRFQEGDAIFVLSAERAGDYRLDFRRLDPLLGVPESKTARIVVTDAAAPLGAPLSGLGVGIMGSVIGSRLPSPTPAATSAGSAGSASSVPPPASGSSATGASSVPVSPAAPQTASTPSTVSAPASASSVPAPTPIPSGSVPGAAAAGSPSAAPVSSVPLASPASSVPSASGAVSTPAPAAPPSSVPAAVYAPASDSHADLLRFARDELAAGRLENARRSLERLVTLYPNSGDESWYLLGRVYEEPGPLRDIRKAHAAYKRVRDEYPESAWWQDAADRVAAIERRYFDIR